MYPSLLQLNFCEVLWLVRGAMYAHLPRVVSYVGLGLVAINPHHMSVA